MDDGCIDDGCFEMVNDGCIGDCCVHDRDTGIDAGRVDSCIL